MLTTNSHRYKLFMENNLDFMKRLPDSSIDLLLTDPPYNLAPFSSGNIHLNPHARSLGTTINETWQAGGVDIVSAGDILISTAKIELILGL